MPEPPGDNKEQSVRDAMRQFIDEQLEGKAPDVEAFVGQYPQFEDRIRQKIQNLQKIDTLFDSIVCIDADELDDGATDQELVGRKIGGFEIVKVIGRGGMGVVYLAHDTKLKRSVAIKSIPTRLADDSNARSRFQSEAELLASLNHPNIAVIYEIIQKEDGASYLVLEYVPGESLAQRIAREPLEMEEALSIGRQVAEAISAAHDSGVIHRDLKPGNIRLTPDGRVRVLDFGLAKTVPREQEKSEAAAPERGRIIGTPAYMSPEQARGETTDQRTDIWSFGCVMFHMLAGQSPFHGQTATDTLAHIIEDQPDWQLLPKETPENIRLLLQRCLEKDSACRLGGIAEAAVEITETLNAPAATTVTPVRTARRRAVAAGLVAIAVVILLVVLKLNTGREYSIAVRPVENLTGDPNQEWFVDAMTGELTDSLGKIAALRVIQRNSVMRYKGSDKSVGEIAQELGNLDAIVECSVSRAGEGLKINVNVVAAVPERRLWGHSYGHLGGHSIDLDSGNILGVAAELAETIAREIKVTVTPEEEACIRSARPVNPQACELYWKGKEHYFTRRKDELEKANECFRKAIKIDPNYAQAYAGLATSYGYQVWAHFITVPMEEARSEIAELVEKALEIDDKLAEAHHASAAIPFIMDLDMIGTEEAFKNAIDLKPNFAEAHYNYAYLLMDLHRFTESIDEARLALQLDPFSRLYRGTLAQMYFLADQYPEARELYLRMAEAEPNSPVAYNCLARLYEQTDRFKDAVEARQKAMRFAAQDKDEEALTRADENAEALGRAYRANGVAGYWTFHLEQVKGQLQGANKEYRLAEIYAQLDDKKRALDLLETAYDNRAPGIYYLSVSPLLDPLRDDPRFKKLLRRMNFPE